MSEWVVYILECSDKTLYTGITTDLARRIKQHDSGKGAKYTKGRGPFQLIYSETCIDRSKASQRESEIKKLSRNEKLSLQANYKS